MRLMTMWLVHHGLGKLKKGFEEKQYEENKVRDWLTLKVCKHFLGMHDYETKSEATMLIICMKHLKFAISLDVKGALLIILS